MHLTRIEIGCRARINFIHRRAYKFIDSCMKLKLVVQMVASCTRCSMEPNPSGIVVMWWIGGPAPEPEGYNQPSPPASSPLCLLSLRKPQKRSSFLDRLCACHAHQGPESPACFSQTRLQTINPNGFHGFVWNISGNFYF